MNRPYTSHKTAVPLQSLFEPQDLSVIASNGYREPEETINMNSRPMQLIIFAKPDMESHLMQSHQSINIDLREKFLVWEEAESAGLIAYSIGEHYSLGESSAFIKRNGRKMNQSQNVFNN